MSDRLTARQTFDLVSIVFRKAVPPEPKRYALRKAVPPEPKRYAQCRNCKHLVYDDHFYMPLGGGSERSRKVNMRCRVNGIKVSLGTVCDGHEFDYADRSDR